MQGAKQFAVDFDSIQEAARCKAMLDQYSTHGEGESQRIIADTFSEVW